MKVFRFFYPFFRNICYIYTEYRRMAMPKAAIKEQAKSKAKPKRLSKAAIWVQNHPNGLGGKPLDMKIMLREYDTPWWET
jgi:hypothetical protein